MSGAPRIGITTDDPTGQTAQRYAAATEAAGGEVTWITPADVRAAGDTRSVLRTLDGLLLSGGRDIDPRMYGEMLIPGIGVEVDADRYEVEVPLAHAAVGEDVPTLGICGGMQALNVASGGSLHQDLSLIGISPAAHNVAGAIIYHPISVAPGSRLSVLFERDELQVNSSHHQAVKRPGKGAVVTASAPDGVIEAIEFPARTFAIGVQWHPDRMANDERQRRLFAALVGAARAGSRSRV